MKKIEREIVGGFVFSSDNKLLLGLMDPKVGGAYAGMWVVPGGGVDEGETREEALVREFIEETGIDLSPYAIKLIDSKFTDDTDIDEREKTIKETGERVLVKMRFNNFEVYMEKMADTINLRPNEEFEQLKWFSLNSLPAGKMSAGVSAALNRWGYIK